MEIFFCYVESCREGGKTFEGKGRASKTHYTEGIRLFSLLACLNLAKASLPPPSLKALMTDRLTDRLNRQLRGKSLIFRHINFNFLFAVILSFHTQTLHKLFFLSLPLANMQMCIYVLYMYFRKQHRTNYRKR